MPRSSESMHKTSPRLIDYIVVVGRKNPSRSGPAIAQPELLRMYPPKSHSDFILPNDIVFFCQPEGCYNTSSRSFVLEPQLNGERVSQSIKTEFFTFTLTDKETNTARFGICLNFLRPIPRRKLSANEEHGRRIALKVTPTNTTGRLSDRRRSSAECMSLSSSSIESLSFRDSSNHDRPGRPFTHTLTSICLVSHYQFFKKFEKCLLLLYSLIQKLHEGCKPRFSGKQTVWSIFTGATSIPSMPIMKRSILEIDTWILRLLSTPPPIAGLTSVKVHLQPIELANPIMFALPNKNRFSLVDYPLYLPIKLLGVEKFLKVFVSLLLEQKILLQSSHYDRLTTCVMAFTTLFYPLQYLFTVIPLLPSSLNGAEQLLQAPSPYIIGLPRSFLGSRLAFKLPKDVLLVDLDTQELYGMGAQDPILKMPLVEEKMLLSHLQKIFSQTKCMEAAAGKLHSEEKVPFLDLKNVKSLESKIHLANFDPLAFDLDEDSINVALRITMALFFKSPNILGDFTDHTRTVRLYPRPVVAFQYERFMKSRPDPSPFTILLAKTQAVEYYAEWSLMPDNTVFQQIDSGIVRPIDIGDKEQWFIDQLNTITFSLWTERFDKGILKPTMEALSASLHNDILILTTGKLMPRSSLTVSSTSGAYEIGTSSESETPTDVSASNGDSQLSSDVAEFSDNEMTESNNHLLASTPTASPSWLKNVIFESEFEEAEGDLSFMEIGKPLPSNLSSYFTPPNVLHLPSSEASTLASDRNFNSPSFPLQGDFTNRTFAKYVERGHFPMSTAADCIASADGLNSLSKRLSEPLTSAITFNSPARIRTFSAANRRSSTLRRRSSLSVPSIPRFLSPESKHNRKENKDESKLANSKANLGSIVSRWFVDASRSREESANPLANKRRIAMERSENRRFIFECTTAIRKGNLPGIFSRRRLQKLLEEEIYRNMALSEISGNMGVLVSDGEGHIKDVCLSSWDQYKSYTWFFHQMEIGIRQSTRPMYSKFIDNRGEIVSPADLATAFHNLFTSHSERERVSKGGICSAFLLLDMAYTHYHLLPQRGSPKGSASAISKAPSASVPTTPKQLDFFNIIPISPEVHTDSMPGSNLESNENIFENHVSCKDVSQTGYNVINILKHTASPLISPKTKHDADAKKEVANLGSKHTISWQNNKDTKSDSTWSTVSDGISMEMVEDVVLLPSFKSIHSFGYRYRRGRLLQTASQVIIQGDKPEVHSPACISVPSLRLSLTDQSKSHLLQPNGNGHAGDLQMTDSGSHSSVSPLSSEGKSTNLISTVPTKPEVVRAAVGRTFIFEEALINSTESKLWTCMQFWEDLFLDTITQEREVLGMDFEPTCLMEHYNEVSPMDQKRLELNEDCLLANVLQNLIAFMVMCRISSDQICKKVRRLIAKSHTGLHYTQQITKLLDCLEYLAGNDIDLLPMLSRQFVPESFPVLLVWDGDSEMMTMDIYEEFLTLRNMEGIMWNRWWFDQIVNVTHSPQANVVCFQTRILNKRERFIFTSTSTNALFNFLATAMNRARAKSQRGPQIDKLGGEVKLIDAETGQPGVINLSPLGFNLHFGDSCNNIPLDNVKSCLVSNEDEFSIIIADPENENIVRRFKTDLAYILVNQWERLIGVALIKNPLNLLSGNATPLSSRSPTSSLLAFQLTDPPKPSAV